MCKFCQLNVDHKRKEIEYNEMIYFIFTTKIIDKKYSKISKISPLTRLGDSFGGADLVGNKISRFCI